MNDVTCILSAIEQGNPSAAELLLPLVYAEFAGWRQHDWLAKSQGRRSRRRPSSTRPTSGWWTWSKRSAGIVGAISSPPPPRP